MSARRRHVRGSQDGGGFGARVVRPARASLHPRVAGLGRARQSRRACETAAGDSRPRALAEGGNRRLRLRAPLQPRDGPLPPRGARTARPRRQRSGSPSGSLLHRREARCIMTVQATTAVGDPAARAGRPVLEADGLKKYFPVRRGLLQRTRAFVRAVDGVSFALAPGETLCLVGESGSGKSTVGRLVLRLIELTDGRVRLEGHDITRLGREEMRPWRKRMQIVFQDPYASLNPRLTAGRIVAEPLENYPNASGVSHMERVARLFERVGLRADSAGKYPFEFSGGQRQRLGLARALALNPALIVADEPVSALDVSVQAQVLNLMMDLQDDLKLAYLFISHDLGVVEHIGHRVAVMYLGRIVEL